MNQPSDKPMPVNENAVKLAHWWMANKDGKPIWNAECDAMVMARYIVAALQSARVAFKCNSPDGCPFKHNQCAEVGHCLSLPRSHEVVPQGDPFNCPKCGAHDYGLHAGKCPHCEETFILEDK